MSLLMACPKADCDGDIEYETERTSNGDGVWAQSGTVGYVLWERVPPAFEQGDRRFQTLCGCLWDAKEVEGLDWKATQRAMEPYEP